MPLRTFDIRFPAAGVVRSGGLRLTADGREPFPTPWAMNVRLVDPLATRRRGGSFVGPRLAAKPDPVYRDRAITFSGSVISASRVGSQADFTYSSDVSDVLRPALFTLAEAGAIGGTVVAVAPCEDAYMLCFTADETWVQQGDPVTGARRNVSREVGIIGPDAWCRDHNTVYFLSDLGLYSVQMDGSGLKDVSDKLPVELNGVDDTTCMLEYSHADKGIYISGESSVSWFYDVENDGFWPYTCAHDSHVLLGPFRLGNAASFGRVVQLHGTLATDSDDVTWRLVTGDTAEQAAANGKTAIENSLVGVDFSSYVASSGTWSEGRSNRAYPRTRAVWCCLWLHSIGTWAWEETIMTAMMSGQWR